MKALNGMSALVTGSSSGIGAATARHFAAAGARVAVNYRSNQAGAEETAKSVREAGSEAIVIRADVGVAADVERMFSEIDDEFGDLDILVNNAGITPWMPLLETPEEVFDRAINTNLRGVFLCSQQAARRMLHKGGAILNISSVHAAVTTFNFGVYAASKGGIESLTRAAAIEWGEYGIRVNALRVGWVSVESDALKPGDPVYEEFCQRRPLQRPASPDEIATMAVQTCSPAASYVTGAVIAVDGGATAKLNIPERRD